MPESAPVVRNDRLYADDVILFCVYQTLVRGAEMVNSLTKAGAIPGQIILPPDEAARKKALMEQGNV
mgnify:FL=1